MDIFGVENGKSYIVDAVFHGKANPIHIVEIEVIVVPGKGSVEVPIIPWLAPICRDISGTGKTAAVIC